MKLLRRKTKLIEIPVKANDFAVICLRTLMIFKRPLALLLHYVRVTLPDQGLVELRNGTKIYLAGHKHDLITVIVVFCKRDYGRIVAGSTVVDIGANIGAFSIYAATMGARQVYAFEPNSAAYTCLLRNIRENGLEDTIVPFKRAVTEKSGEQVAIPISASPYNKIRRAAEGDVEGAVEHVGTITLDDIVAEQAIHNADVLKIDCEGAEYAIFPATQAATLSTFAHIRMEYHRGPLPELRANLEARDFRVVKVKPETTDSGIMWLSQQLRQSL